MDDGLMTSGSVDPAAEFLAREQDQLADIGDDTLLAATNVSAQPELSQVMSGVGSLSVSDSEKTSSASVPDDTESVITPVVAVAAAVVQREEPETIRKWRETQQQRLQEKDTEEESKKAEWREVAAKELADWYKQHDESVEKVRAVNRDAEKELSSMENKSTRTQVDWEQISRLCDFNQKTNRSTRDTARMRTLILQLKQEVQAA